MRSLPLIAILLAGCSMTDSQDVTGRYAFDNSYGFTESVVVRPGFSEEISFSVEGFVDLVDDSGSLSGTGTCSRFRVSRELPADKVTESEDSGEAKFSGNRSGDQLIGIKLTGCAFPRTMWGSVKRGNLVLETDLDFPVSRGTTVISDRFGDPTALIMTRQ